MADDLQTCNFTKLYQNFTKILTQTFSCEYCEIFKNSVLIEHFMVGESYDNFIMRNHFWDVTSTCDKLVTQFVQITLDLRYINLLHIRGYVKTKRFLEKDCTRYSCFIYLVHFFS